MSAYIPDRSFLGRVADVYSNLSIQELADICFVLPNKRSMAFLRQELIKRRKGPFIEPALIDISEFVAGFSNSAEASRYEMLFTLYRCYANINRNTEISFDKFIFWGEMLVSDFNDVDRYLVDADMLFSNLERLKEIGSNYLTPEQIEKIRRYWDAENIEEDTGRFWKHLDNNDSFTRSSFIKLWEVLGPLYHDYMRSLEDNGLTTSGAMYRNSVERLSAEGASCLTFSKYVFVGFNVLTTSELKIFRKLKALGRGEFFWDFNSPALINEENKAGRFIRKNMEEFPAPPQFDDEPLTSMPHIDIIGVPSNVGQTKVAGKIVEKWQKENRIKTDRGEINTAIILPDESLFMPLVHSMPGTVTDMNVTMGFPMRLSPIASLIGNIWKLQRNARRTSGDVDTYFFEDVKALLSMPMVRALDATGAADILRTINDERLFTVPPEVIRNSSEALYNLFIPLNRRTPPDEVTTHIIRLLDFLLAATDESDKLQIYFLESYRSAVANLHNSVARFDMQMDAFTFLHMVDRAVRGDTVNFVGEPLSGLQIMGMLETRTLDFENIIITSMNERVFPRKLFNRSFIPDVLRRGYGMATTDFSESIFAYYFYRMISRARHVALLYDSRTVGGTRSSEMSRYLVQLLYLFPGEKTHHINAAFHSPMFKYEATAIQKTGHVLEKLNRFLEPGSRYALSASAINTYINCPLEFYLRYVERFSPDEDPVDYVNSSTYGLIVHQVLENFYKALPPVTDGSGQSVDPELVRMLIRPSYPLLDQLLLEAINNNYHNIHCPAKYKTPAGETAVLATVIRRNVCDVLEAEAHLGQFTFENAELKLTGTISTTSGLKVNIKQVIDRIDRIADEDSPSGTRLRIVDYKTGSDSLEARTLESLFDTTSSHRPKAIMQLLFYCMFYAQKTGYTEAIQPLIYSLRNIPVNGIRPLVFAKSPLMDYRDLLDDFNAALSAVLEEIFNPEVPFHPSAAGEDACTFCNFKSICSRGEES